MPKPEEDDQIQKQSPFPPVPSLSPLIPRLFNHQFNPVYCNSGPVFQLNVDALQRETVHIVVPVKVLAFLHFLKLYLVVHLLELLLDAFVEFTSQL